MKVGVEVVAVTNVLLCYLVLLTVGDKLLVKAKGIVFKVLVPPLRRLLSLTF